MAKRASVTQAEIRRALQAAKECGYDPQECIMTHDSVRIVFTPLDAPPKSDDTPKPREWPR